MAVSLVSTGVTFPDSSTQTTAATGFGFKNRIINGAQVINQRAASVTSAGTYVTDRFQWDSNTTTATLTFAQSSTAPTGFTNSLGITVGTADTSIAAGDLVDFRHWIEGNNVADFGLGTASAVTFTVSFWVRSSVTGTYGASFRNSDASRVYVSTFAINAANTWEYKTITVAGDTTGTWYTDNQRGLGMNICLAGGSNFQTTAGAWTAAGNYRTTSAQANFLATTGNTFYITGVQLEKGSTATSFDYRPYGTELALCQRYYYKVKAKDATSRLGMGWVTTTTTALVQTTFPVTMRTNPTSLEQSGTAGDYRIEYTNTAQTCSTVPIFTSADAWGAITIPAVSSGLTAGQGAFLRSINSNAYLAWSVEL
jgi:hypothetical protein